MAWLNEGRVFASTGRDATTNARLNLGLITGNTVAALRAHSFPEGLVPTAMVAYRGGQVNVLQENLLVAIRDVAGLLRLVAKPDGTVVESQWLLTSLGPIQALTLDLEGRLYVCAGGKLLAVTPVLTAS